MSLEQYTPEQIKEMSMLEVAYEVFLSRKDAISFQELVKEVQNHLEMSDAELQTRLAQFYTDLNIDGRFITLGDNRWGLRTWYPYEQIDEEIISTPKPKKKKSKKKKDEDDDIVDFDELDEDELDYDELDDFEDEDEEIEDLDEEEDEEEDDVDVDFDDLDDDEDDEDFEDDELLEDEYVIDEDDEELDEEEEEE